MSWMTVVVKEAEYICCIGLVYLRVGRWVCASGDKVKRTTGRKGHNKIYEKKVPREHKLLLGYDRCRHRSRRYFLGKKNKCLYKQYNLKI